MHKKMFVSVGIPTYNEEKNIRLLLSDILSQNQKGWELQEIIISDDASTDATVNTIKKIHNKKITVFSNAERKGKATRLNEIFKCTKADITVLFDADVRLTNSDLITHLIEPMIKNKTVMLVGGNSVPFTPQTFFEKAVYQTFLVFEESRKQMQKGNNIFGCTGACLGLRKHFAKSVKIPSDVLNDDDYLYFMCKEKGYAFFHVKNAIVNYALPQTVSDYLRQAFRSNPEAVYEKLTHRFGKAVRKEYKRTFTFYAQAILKALIQSPLPTMYIILINLVIRPIFPFVSRKYKLTWFTAKSTKIARIGS
jgi:glycosyltransferase involved in cell wall biosynthesis